MFVCLYMFGKKNNNNCIRQSVSAAFSLVRLQFHPPLGLRPQQVVLNDEVRQSEVDIVIQLVDLEAGTTINLVPLEVISVITKENMTQLTTYLFRLSSAEQLQRRSVVLLITGRVIQMCFLCLTNDSPSPASSPSCPTRSWIMHKSTLLNWHSTTYTRP